MKNLKEEMQVVKKEQKTEKLSLTMWLGKDLQYDWYQLVKNLL